MTKPTLVKAFPAATMEERTRGRVENKCCTNSACNKKLKMYQIILNMCLQFNFNLKIWSRCIDLKLCYEIPIKYINDNELAR